MSDLKERLAEIWERLNPSEPSPTYLMKLMAFMIGAFVFGLIVGNIR
ncbi:hypothetical protein [Palleronia sp.]